jgi:3-oxoadipate enol-lactonase
MEALTAAGARCLAPDLPGFGGSPFKEGAWRISKVARCFNDWLDQMGLTQVIVVGISMGGVVALQFALDYPERVSSLVLVNTFASLRPKRLSEWVYLLQRYIRVNLKGVGAQADLVANRLFPGEDQAELRRIIKEQIVNSDPKVYRGAMRELGLINLSKRLSEIQIPTLVISGERDTTVPLENQVKLAQGIKNARQVVIPGAGHAVIADQPEAFNNALSHFLKLERLLPG